MPPQEKFGSKVPDEPSQEELGDTLSAGGAVVVNQSPTADEDCDGNIQVLVPVGKIKSANNKPDLKDVDFDDLLPHVGEFGTYQKILFILMIPFAFYVAWVYFSQIFITLVPEEHWCKVPELMDLPVDRRLVVFFSFPYKMSPIYTHSLRIYCADSTVRSRLLLLPRERI